MFTEAAKQGSGDAFFGIGYMYEHGIGVAESQKSACDFYEKACALKTQLDDLARDRIRTLTPSS